MLINKLYRHVFYVGWQMTIDNHFTRFILITFDQNISIKLDPDEVGFWVSGPVVEQAGNTSTLTPSN